MSMREKPSGGRGVSWRERETLDLLSFWGEEKVQDALALSHRNIDIFDKIAEQMANRGHNRTAQECRTKTKALRQEYKRVLAHNSQSGSSPATCPFYRELHSILQGDVNVKPRRLPRNISFTTVDVAPKPPLEERGQSEELTSQDDLVPINVDCVCSSTPEDFVLGESLPVLAESVPVDGGVDENRITDCEDPGEGGSQAALPDSQELQPSTPPHEQQGSNEGRNVAAVSPATRLAGVRSRKRRVAMLHDVAERLLMQCATEQEEAARRHREAMEEERRQHQDLLEEGRRDRQLFKDTMQQNMSIMLAAVNALQSLGELLASKQQPVHVQETPQTVDAPLKEEQGSQAPTFGDQHASHDPAPQPVKRSCERCNRPRILP